MLDLEQDSPPAWFTQTFKVGDRVVGRPSPECPAYDLSPINQRLNGVLGTVTEIGPVPEGHIPGHIYTVWWDAPFDGTTRVSAAEMDLLDCASDG